MRKFVSIIFFLLLVLSLPGLVKSINAGQEVSSLIGQATASILFLILGLHFWKPSKKNEES